MQSMFIKLNGDQSKEEFIRQGWYYKRRIMTNIRIYIINKIKLNGVIKIFNYLIKIIDWHLKQAKSE